MSEFNTISSEVLNQIGAFPRKECAERMNVSLPTFDAYLRRADNPIPHFRAGKKVLIPALGFAQWLEEEAKRQTVGR